MPIEQQLFHCPNCGARIASAGCFDYFATCIAFILLAIVLPFGACVALISSPGIMEFAGERFGIVVIGLYVLGIVAFVAYVARTRT